MSRPALTFATDASGALPLHVVGPEGLEDWIGNATPAARAWVEASPFKAAAGQTLVVPGTDGRPEQALVGLGPVEGRARHRFSVAAAREALHGGVWQIATELEPR